MLIMKHNNTQGSGWSGNSTSKVKAFLVSIILPTLFILSCNQDFPEANKEPLYILEQEFDFPAGTTAGTLNIDLQNDRNTTCTLFMFPKWFSTSQIEFPVSKGNISIPFEFRNIDQYMNQGSAQIILKVNGTGYFQATINYGLYNPNPDPGTLQPLTCSTALLDFGMNDELEFVLTNPNPNASVDWSAVNVPPWLQLSPMSGMAPPNSAFTIKGTVNRSGLMPGEFQQQIDIRSVSPQASLSIMVRMQVANTAVVNTKNIKWIEGDVTDAYFCKSTDYLYILTQNPNAIWVKAPGADTLISHALAKSPNCMDITSDGKTVAIGYNQANVDLFDSFTLALKRSYETDCIPAEIVFGENGWCYLTPTLDQWEYLYSLNLTSGVTYRRSTEYPIYAKAYFIKMPGKPFLYGTNPGLSPGGLMIVNITNGEANDTIANWHVETGGALWISKDGKKIFAANKRIFRLPEYTANSNLQTDLPVLGTLDVPKGFIRSLDYNESLDCFFAAGSDFAWTASGAETIYQLNGINYSAEKSFKVGSYPAQADGVYNKPMDVFHLFSSPTGQRLYAVKKVSTSSALPLKWALEMIDVF